MSKTSKRIVSLIIALIMCAAVMMPMVSCGDTDNTGSTAETTPAPTPEASTPEATPEASTPESTPEASNPDTTPESTPETTTPDTTPPAPEHNISYDLDGGIDGGNPLEYDPTKDLTLIVPIRPGYDFAGWTGTGLDTPTTIVTIPAGTEGNLSFKANWTENGEFSFDIDNTTEDIFGKIFFGGSKAAFVVNGEDAYETNIAVNASGEIIIQKLQAYFEKHGQVIKMLAEDKIDDYSKYDFLMYFGICDRPEVEEFVGTLNYAQYGVEVTENSITFIAWTEVANAEAAEILYEIIDHVVKGGSISDFAGARYVGMVEGTVGEDLPALPGLDGGTDVGEGAYQVYTLEATKEIYDAYLKSLEAAGYTYYTSNVMNKTYCATYYNDKEVVNVMFAGEEKKSLEILHPDHALRVVVDPIEITALPSLEKPADADAEVVVSSISQLYPTDLCLVVQLSNGNFIVVDSGRNGTQKAISDFLRKMAPDGNPVVEAWIFTHFHIDHIGGFVEYMGVSSLTRYITVKSIIYNFPSYRTYMTAESSPTDMNNMSMWYNTRIPALRESGTTIYQARTGQKYFFGNAEVEILWTFEDMTPFNILTDSTNRTSIGFSITIEGQKLMVTGDSTEEQFRVVAARYGDYLRSDFVQLSHHGNGNYMGTHNFYEKVDAAVAFHPDHNKKLTYKNGENEVRAAKNADVIIRCGNYQNATLMLPYTVGDEIISDKVPTDERDQY